MSGLSSHVSVVLTRFLIFMHMIGHSRHSLMCYKNAITNRFNNSMQQCHHNPCFPGFLAHSVLIVPFWKQGSLSKVQSVMYLLMSSTSLVSFMPLPSEAMTSPPARKALQKPNEPKLKHARLHSFKARTINCYHGY